MLYFGDTPPRDAKVIKRTPVVMRYDTAIYQFKPPGPWRYLNLHPINPRIEKHSPSNVRDAYPLASLRDALLMCLPTNSFPSSLP